MEDRYGKKDVLYILELDLPASYSVHYNITYKKERNCDGKNSKLSKKEGKKKNKKQNKHLQ